MENINILTNIDWIIYNKKFQNFHIKCIFLIFNKKNMKESKQKRLFRNVHLFFDMKTLLAVLLFLLG